MMVGVNTEVDSCIQQETVPPRPRRGKLGRKFYEDNKEAILRDYQDLTLKEFYAKRAIWAGTWTALKRAWGIQGKYPKNAHRKPIADKATDEPKVTKVSKVTKVNKGNLVSLGTFTVEAASELPAFPAFNDNWPMLTQIEWLQTYRVLRERG
uniref:Uncharacterized protein n=1 Tax=viral metagenome TaxID=1070528 RepID=A0A6M3IRS5_9ZZZZ